MTRLARLARLEQEELFDRHPEWAQRYRSAELFSILTGEAANHYVSGQRGFISFQIYTFFAEERGDEFPRIRRACRDFGASRHGREPDAPPTFTGRQVWLDHRAMAPDLEVSPLEALQSYLRSGGTPTAQRLRAGTVVFIAPAEMRGIVAWPALALSHRRSRS